VSRTLALLLACGALPGCGSALQLRLASDAERLPAPRFVVEGTRGGAGLRQATFSVSACPLQPLLWALTPVADAALALPLHLRYGAAPSGLQESAPAAPLVAGRRYLAAFVVGHRSSTQVFRVERDGRVVAEEDGQACARAAAAPLQGGS
jgi:hypothetical protein